MKSNSLLKTNVGLTGNVKIVFNEKNKMFLETINSKNTLLSSKLKKKEFNKDNFYDELIPHFFKNVDNESIFYIQNDNVSDNNYNSQYNTLYEMGLKDITSNKDYDENCEYFAPLHINKNNLPKAFIIFRVENSNFIEITKDNFKSKFLNNLKLVKLYDLKDGDIGYWLNKNFTSNKNYENGCFEFDFNKLSFSTIEGIDVKSGGYAKKSFFAESFFSEEKTFYQFNLDLLNQFKNNNLIYKNILNLSFLFNDVVATPTSIKEWSLNNYTGFYIDDLILDKTIYLKLNTLNLIKNDVKIIRINGLNIIKTSSSYNPFLKEIENPNIEIDGVIYSVVKTKLNITSSNTATLGDNYKEDVDNQIITVDVYKILSDADLSNRESDINKNIYKITHLNGKNILDNISNNLTIENFNNYDLWVCEYDNSYHIVKYDNEINKYIIHTDYYINSDDLILETYINNRDVRYYKSYDVNNINIKLYKCVFTPISDIDTSIINSEFANVEYEKNELVNYTNGLISSSNNGYNDLLDVYKYRNEELLIPSSSEFVFSKELFINTINILNKNITFVKWGYSNSNINNYRYMLNNNTKLLFNNSIDIYDNQTSVINKSLDYFITFGVSGNYLNYNKHIINGSISLNESELINPTNLNYFNSLFENNIVYSDGLKNKKMYSLFNKGNTNNTVFNGMKISALLNKSNKYNPVFTNDLSDYKFSILLSKNKSTTLSWDYIDRWDIDKQYNVNDIVIDNDILYICRVETNPSNNIIGDNGVWNYYTKETIFRRPFVNYQKKILISYSDSLINCELILNKYEFESIEKKSVGDKLNIRIIVQNIGFVATTIEIKTITSEINENDITYTILGELDINSQISNLNLIDNTEIVIEYELSVNKFNINIPPIVNNNGEYYYLKNRLSNIDFWISKRYPKGVYVVYKDKIYISNKATSLSPDSSDWDFISKNNLNSSMWAIINLYDINKPYKFSTSQWDNSFERGHYIIYNQSLYYTISDVENNSNPTSDNRWILLYTFEPQNNFIYNKDLVNNNIINNGKSLICCKANVNSILDSGINIYVNKNNKTVLFNIYVNDNTINEISNITTDMMYSNTSFDRIKVTNFIKNINNLDNTVGLINNIVYYYIDGNGYEKVDLNNNNQFNNLKYIFKVDDISEIEILSKLDIKNGNDNNIIIKNKIVNKTISDVNEINYYDDFMFTIQNKNIYNKDYIYRYSGYYDLILNEISVFDIGYKKFNTEYTNFGLTKTIIGRIYDNVIKTNNLTLLNNNANDEINKFIFKSSNDNKFYKII